MHFTKSVSVDELNQGTRALPVIAKTLHAFFFIRKFVFHLLIKTFLKLGDLIYEIFLKTILIFLP